ncbi:Adenosine monophosphate-protein transferase [Marinomonas aquimarina]|uniref:protein adenylyltransferase n=1 Tax=Marinomonas aquimarina TaxID=295068 RepID=A0A1A8TAF2_9GAMM|nr:Fic family protein [Marinomonas aquimarina]SBS28471.1 Adenosine monophosphate-protein transferase [Marinomonas aquimarina]
MSRYQLDTAEAKYQPGSNHQVLLNKLNVTDLEEMHDIEAQLLFLLYTKVFSHPTELEAFTFQDIISWHRQWLGNVYYWAGRIRNVRMSKQGFEFAAPPQIVKLIHQFEQAYLAKIPQISQLSKDELVSLLAQTHVEFILIHPFREGNGRISRLLMDYMSWQAGYGLLDYSLWDTHKAFYFRSIQAGVGGDYQYIERLVRDILDGES